MTTIPIEVIIQDAEAPIVPSDGTDTNTNTEAAVAVPDTGGSGSNIFTGSASAIVLPAILLVLAIGTIVAVLIHKYHKQKNNKTTKKEKLAVATSSTIAVLAVAVLIGNLVLPATKAATSDIEDGITPSEDKVSIVVTRDSGSVEESTESTATITSTSDFGYKVLLSMAEGVETSNLYLNGDEASQYYIASVEAENEEGVELADNTWGFALTEDGEYSAIPLLDDAIAVAQGYEPVEDEELSIYYGVKVSSDLPVGTYSGGEIEYTLELVPGFPDTLVYMQDMTPEICAAAPTPGNSVTDPVPTATLIDSRDNKAYTIAKLADGKCWMTQNLDLDLRKDGTITYNSTNTNLTVAGSGAYENGYTVEDGVITWTPVNATINFTGDTVAGWESNTAPYTANPGDVYYYTSGTDEPDTTYDSLELCMKDHAAEDCKHYHAGNYYNWSAAVASNDSSSLTTQYDNAANSICPAGWRLPNGPSIDNVSYSEILGMVKSYAGVLGDLTHCGGSCFFYNYEESGFEAVRRSPLWLARSGWFETSSSRYGVSGFYVSGTVSSNSDFFETNFNSGQLWPMTPMSKSFGFSIRCVAK